jgi:HSP20 family protein
MELKLLPSKWLNKKHSPTARKESRTEYQEEHPMSSLQNEMNRLFDDFFRASEMPMFEFSSSNSLHRQSAVSPRIDVHETENELRVSVELPGLSEKDIDVSLSRELLTISGEKKQESEQNVKGWYCIERSYGNFSRSIPLPCEIDQESCNASFKNGVLTVSLTKSPQSKANTKCIPIKKE